MGASGPNNETSKNPNERTQPKPLVANAGFGFAIAAPNRRPPFRAEPVAEPQPKTRTAGGA